MTMEITELPRFDVLCVSCRCQNADVLVPVGEGSRQMCWNCAHAVARHGVEVERAWDHECACAPEAVYPPDVLLRRRVARMGGWGAAAREKIRLEPGGDEALRKIDESLAASVRCKLEPEEQSTSVADHAVYVRRGLTAEEKRMIELHDRAEAEVVDPAKYEPPARGGDGFCWCGRPARAPSRERCGFHDGKAHRRKA